MPAPSQNALGAALIVLTGLTNTANLVVSRKLQALQLPYFRIVAAAMFLGASGILCYLLAARPRPPPWRVLKWVLLRGFFSPMQMVVLIIAVRCGTPLGDAGALSSSNVVFAALLGRLVLGEPLRRPHAVGVALSLAGGVLISKPEFLFGGASGAGLTFLGCSLALTSGFLASCAFITARKSPGALPVFHTMSTMSQRCVICAIMGSMPAMKDGSVELAAQQPWRTAGWVLLMACMLFCGNYANSAGSQKCPAAVSATVLTATIMVGGYVSQTVLFGESPDAVTLSGAGLMLLAVVVMTGARLPRQAAPAVTPEAAAEAGAEVPSEGAAAGPENLASFISREFAAESPHFQTEPEEPEVAGAARQRRPGGGGMAAAEAAKAGQPAQVLGAAGGA